MIQKHEILIFYAQKAFFREKIDSFANRKTFKTNK